MSLVAKLLSPTHVVTDLQVSSKKRLFEQAGLLFENQHGIARSLVFDSLFARERLGSTGLGVMTRRSRSLFGRGCGHSGRSKYSRLRSRKKFFTIRSSSE